MFKNIDQQVWYEKYFYSKTIIAERLVIYEDFEQIGVRQNSTARGWLNCVKSVGPVYECLVREFYSNAKEIGPRHFHIYVREWCSKLH